MRRLVSLAALLLCSCSPPATTAVLAPTTAPVSQIRVYFSPRGGAEAAILEQLAAAKVSIDVQAYSFTSTAIAKALISAHDRGVKVRAVLDQGANGKKYSVATLLAAQGVPVWLDGAHPIAHNKIIIIDGATVITGSYNFTKQAEERNAENLLVICGRPDLAAQYEANFEKHLKHSTRSIRQVE